MAKEKSIEEQEMAEAMEEAAEKIFLELVGFTVKQAKGILKLVAPRIEERAVIEEGE